MSPLMYLIFFFGIVNLIRLTVLLVGSDIYSLNHRIKFKKHKLSVLPKVSVVIPAHNEEKNILQTISSVVSSNYPASLLEIIIVNDGSTDNTLEKLSNIKIHKKSNIKIVDQSNLGKASALNNGIKNYSTGEIIMCLDADSFLDINAIRNSIKYFEDEKVMALSSNIKISKRKGLLNLVQQFEYIVSYQMKKGLTIYNTEYIIGGVGSTFRKSYLEKIDFYDTNTVTEDIDLSMKILRAGNRNVRVVYGTDVISYTQGVLSISDLVRQRYRWKWGRCQTFFKNRDMFFTLNKDFTKGLTWIYLPLAIYGEIAFLFEPIILLVILTNSIIYKNPYAISAAFLIMSFYTIMNILAEDTIRKSEKLKLVAVAPLMYFLFYIVSYAEYFALIKTVVNLPNLKKSISLNRSRWIPVKRYGMGSQNNNLIDIAYISFLKKSSTFSWLFSNR